MSIHKIIRKMKKSAAVFTAWAERQFFVALFALVSFHSDIKARSRVMIGSLVGLILGGYLAGAMLPDSIAYLTNSTNWADTPAAVQTLGGEVAGIIMIVIFLLMLLRMGGLSD